MQAIGNQANRGFRFSVFGITPQPSAAAMALTAKPISSPVPIHYYPTLSVLLLTVGFVVTASFFIYEATAARRRRSRSLFKEVITGAIASFFLGFGTLFLLLATGVYV